jgi:hypothetical protein
VKALAFVFLAAGVALALMSVGQLMPESESDRIIRNLNEATSQTQQQINAHLVAAGKKPQPISAPEGAGDRTIGLALLGSGVGLILAGSVLLAGARKDPAP